MPGSPQDSPVGGSTSTRTPRGVPTGLPGKRLPGTTDRGRGHGGPPQQAATLGAQQDRLDVARRAEPASSVISDRSSILSTEASHVEGLVPGILVSGQGSPEDFEPIRTCVGCRTRVARSDLLRIVVVGGELLPDVRRRMHGRGAHVHPDLACVELAERRKAFPRALRVPGPLGLKQVRAHLEQRTRNTCM